MPRHPYHCWFPLLLLTSTVALAFEPAHLEQLRRGDQCNGCDLRNAPLADSNLVGRSLRWAVLAGSNLAQGNLERADLTGADLRGARLQGASLQGAVLEGALLDGVDLSDTRLAGADLRWARLPHLDIDRDLEFLELTGVILHGATFKHGIRCAALPAKGGWGCVAEERAGR